MIKLRADAVITVIDSYSGKTVNPSAFCVFLDDKPYRPQQKEGGLLVFINLEPGEHKIRISSVFYSDEEINISVTGEGLTEKIISLKPTGGYSFGKDVAFIHAVVVNKSKEQPGEKIKLAVSGGNDIKIAQDIAGAGDTESKLFIKGGYNLCLPMEYLITDGKIYETNILTVVSEDIGSFLSPLENNYKRGSFLVLCQNYETDNKGVIKTAVKAPSTIFVPLSGKLLSYEMTAGENKITIDV